MVTGFVFVSVTDVGKLSFRDSSIKKDFRIGTDSSNVKIVTIAFHIITLVFERTFLFLIFLSGTNMSFVV